MSLAGRPVAAFDPEGLIFAVGINSESVKLYDLRSFDKGPFSSFKFQGTFTEKRLIPKFHFHGKLIFFCSWQRHWMDRSEIQPRRKNHFNLYQRKYDSSHRRLQWQQSPDLHRSHEHKKYSVGSFILAGFSIRIVRIYGRKSTYLECGKRDENLRFERRSYRTRTLLPIQSEIHDDGVDV